MYFSSWESPSNIAIVKYWGKFGNQLPKNTSISLTLKKAKTITAISAKLKKNKNTPLSLDFKFHEKSNLIFQEKIEKVLSKFISEFTVLRDYNLIIESENSFPHSAGIASSASGMAALFLSLLDIEYQINSRPLDEQFWITASKYARIGSGSACRSIKGSINIWGQQRFITGSSNESAIQMNVFSPKFNNFHDDICIVSDKEKKVSSTQGHKLMTNHPFAQQRFALANDRAIETITALQSGDLQKFGEIAEAEALMLHALMLCSDPGFILINANTLTIIELIRDFRNQNKIPVYFTMDAGPNIHLLYPDEVYDNVQPLVEQIRKYCTLGQIIQDQLGQGSRRLI